MDNPNEVSGLNCTISTQTMGTYRLRATKILHGVNIMSSEGKASVRRAFYPFITTSSGFGLEVVFPSYESRTKFSEWMRLYMERTVAGRGFKAPVWVDVPSRKFSRSCIAEGPVQFGEGITDIGYTQMLNFSGASDPLDIGPNTRGVRSFFVMPTKDVKHSKNYYPGGIQLSGADDLDGAIYDGWEIGGGHIGEPETTPEYSGDPNSGGP